MNATADGRAAATASSQAGVVTRRQALDAGLSSRQIHTRVSSGEWQRLVPSVFHLTASTISWWTWAFTGVLAGGKGATLIGASAAAVRNWLPASYPVMVAVPLNARPRWPSGFLVARRISVPAEDTVNSRGLSITTRVRTAVDLAQTLPMPEAQDVLDRLLVLGRLTIDEMVDAVALSHRWGARQAHSLVQQALDGAASRAERVAHELFRAAGIDGFIPNYVVWARSISYKVDLAFVEAKVAIEINGWAVHRLPDRGRADYAKSADLQAAGWMVLTFTWHDLVDRPDEVVARVAAALRSRAA